MSKWSQKRKTTYIIILILVLIALFALVIRSITNKEPTCFDGVKNGQETGLDCGGACAQICREEVRDLVLWWERAFEVAPGVYNAVAYIENQNLESGIREIDYEFTFYDKDNVLAAPPYLGKTFIESNKRTAIFAPGIKTGDKDIVHTYFRFSENQKWKRVDTAFVYDSFEVLDRKLVDQDTSPKLSAKIRNKNYYNFVDIPVVAILFNNEGNAIASSQTYIDRLEQGQETEVFFSWPYEFLDLISRIEIIPKVDPFLSREKITS